MAEGNQAKKILVVDDEVDIARLLVVRLKSSGYVVSSAPDGAAAWEAIQRDTPDLVVSDVMMPPPNGFELCRKIKEDPRFKAIPVVLLSAKSMAADRDEGMGSGADLYLTKPYDRQELLAQISKLLNA